MVFSSPVFIFLFLPLALSGYWLIGRKSRNLFLLGASLLFYVWGDGGYVVVLLLSILANYFFGILIDKYREHNSKAKTILFLAVIANLGLLIWYKYAEFIALNLNLILIRFKLPLLHIQSKHLPLGISFFIFQALAYVIDVYRQQNKPQRNPVQFAIFMALFPKITAGPIIRYHEVVDDLAERTVSLELFTYGIKRFIIGLGKKVLIADTLAKTADQIFSIPSVDLTAGPAWLGIFCYTLQIYFDFSGYSDMAIGLGRLFGFRFQENFNYPYIARSLTDFWRRWHISLSSWLRDYLFIPLTYAFMTEKIRQKIVQGKYKTNYRSLACVVIVFTLCGLWHGAGWTFIVWGMLHGIILAVENLRFGKILKKSWLPIQHVYLLLIVMISWVFFRSPTLNGAIGYLKGLLGVARGTGIQYHLSLYLDAELVLAMTAGVIGMMPATSAIRDYLKKYDRYNFTPALEAIGLISILIISLALMANSTYNPFIYQQF